jgi:hypothetical protein
MEKLTTQQSDRLLNYLDGKMSGAEVEVLRKQLESSPLLRQRLEELQVVHSFLNARAEINIKPSPAFTDRVMNNLDKAPAIDGAISPRNGLLLLGGIIVAVSIGILLIASGFFDTVNAPIQLTNLQLPEEIKNLSLQSIPFNGKMLMKFLIVINLGLAFLVLDRTVLKPYFEKKHHSQSVS